MIYETNGNEILLKIPANNSGKYRFKKRKNRFEFGKTFSTRKDVFDNDVYLEWQIGYDVTVKDHNGTNKKTRLSSHSFVGDNKKEKYPYELSEILYEAMKIDLIDEKGLRSLFDEISKYKVYIDEKHITVQHDSQITFNEIAFEEVSILLPTLLAETLDNTQIEISIQKQQYASGVQPMLYFCIPFHCFKNYKEFLNKSSVKGDELLYIIDKSNISNILMMMRISGMTSKRHNYDIKQIIRTLALIKGWSLQ